MPLIVKNTQVKKLYQQSQTVKTQVKKAYVQTGGIKTQVYSSEEILVLPDGTSNVNAILKAWNGSSWTNVLYTPGGGNKSTSGTNGNIYVQAVKNDGAQRFYLHQNNSTVGYNGAQIYLDTTKIDFSSFNTLKFDFFSNNTKGNGPQVTVRDALYTGNPQFYSGDLAVQNLAQNTSLKTYSIDVSSIKGTGHYICIRVYAVSGDLTGNYMYFSNFVLK